MKKVLLISPPVRNPREVSLIPSGLLSIGGFLRKSASGGYEVKVYDSCFPNQTSYQEKIEKTNKMIKEYAPDFLGLGFPTEAFESAIEIAKQVKDIDNNIIIVVGGIHPTAKPEETLNIPYFDFLVHGEGEITTKELFDAIIHKKDIGDVKGISYKRNEKIINNTSRPEILNLDQIPFDNRDLLIDFEKYSKEALGQIHTSRGCPYNCAYCSSSIIWGKKVRFRSAANVIKEIDYLYHQYQVKDINFADDNFLLDPEQVRAICKELIKRKYKIHWRCCARADIHRHFDSELLRLMHKAGCRQICIGFESGAQNLLDKVERGVKISDMEKILKIMKDARIRLHADFIIGLPGEKEETLQQTFRLMQRVWKICRPTMTVALFKPYPGTKIVEQVVVRSERSGSRRLQPAKRDTSVEHSRIKYDRTQPEGCGYRLIKKLFAFAENCNIKRLSSNPVYVYKKFIKNINSPKNIWSLFKKGIRAWI
jgi:anaerobic magnesium-protoporphyrin IX monomethyl ester cyclase